jgi:RNA polymerase sigma factor (sigma-70 family)
VRSIRLLTEQAFRSEDREPSDVDGDGNKVVGTAFEQGKKPDSAGHVDLTALLARLEPVIRTIAHQVMTSGRTGSLEIEDLLQVGRIAAFKQIRSFVEGTHGNTLERWCSFRITAEMKELVRLQSADVTVSDHAQRGHLGVEAATIKVEVSSRDAVKLKSDGEERRRVIPRNEVEFADPEMLFGSEEVRMRVEQAVHKLPPEERELVTWHYGFGVPEKSIRELAHAWKQPRSRMVAMLNRAKAHLAALLAELGHD